MAHMSLMAFAPTRSVIVAQTLSNWPSGILLLEQQMSALGQYVWVSGTSIAIYLPL